MSQILKKTTKLKMSVRDNSMLFIEALPRPLNFESSKTDEGIEKENQIKAFQRPASTVKFLNYTATMRTLDFLSRDISMPFKILEFFAKNKDIVGKENDFKFSCNTQTVLMKKTRLTVIKLEILNRSEKRQSLSFIPDSLARCLNDLNYLTFVEIFSTFMDVFKTWVEALKTSKIQKVKTKKFYSTQEIKKLKIDKLLTVLENIFVEGFNLFGKPSLKKLNYRQFQRFLNNNAIAYCGPFEVKFNGDDQISFFVAGKLNCLRFFNDNIPLFGNFQFPNLSSNDKFENVPRWFLEPPQVINFEIDDIISNLSRTSFV